MGFVRQREGFVVVTNKHPWFVMNNTNWIIDNITNLVVHGGVTYCQRGNECSFFSDFCPDYFSNKNLEDYLIIGWNYNHYCLKTFDIDMINSVSRNMLITLKVVINETIRACYFALHPEVIHRNGWSEFDPGFDIRNQFEKEAIIFAENHTQLIGSIYKIENTFNDLTNNHKKNKKLANLRAHLYHNLRILS
jgi:hypothetical protein